MASWVRRRICLAGLTEEIEAEAAEVALARLEMELLL